MTIFSPPRRSSRAFLLIAACIAGLAALPAHALGTSDSNTSLGQALNAPTFKTFFSPRHDNGLSLGSSLFSGRSSGLDPKTERGVKGLGVLGQSSDRFAELEGDQRVYALLVDGKYDFAYDFGTGLALHPYIGGGLGLALYEGNSAVARLSQDGGMVPLFRVGGGIVYKMGAAWDLSLNYKAGYSGNVDSLDIFTGRSQERVNLQSLDMGLKYRF